MIRNILYFSFHIKTIVENEQTNTFKIITKLISNEIYLFFEKLTNIVFNYVLIYICICFQNVQ